jgi:hypothetical protein
MITNDGYGFLVDWDLANDANSTGVLSLEGIVRIFTNNVCIYVNSMNIEHSAVYVRQSIGKS